MALCLYCYFIVILFYIEWKGLEKFSHNITPDVQIIGKFEPFNVITGNIKILKNSWITKNFNQNEKL